MRLFIGLQPSAAFRTALSRLQEQLRAAGVTGRWLEPRNLHLTLAFIGEWPEPFSGILPMVEHPFQIRLSHPDLFPKARVLWAGVEASEKLNDLAAEVRHNLTEAGIPFDPKPFYPHITLARKPAGFDRAALRELPVLPAVMTVSEVCLYRSERGENGMEYTVIGSSGAQRAPDDRSSKWEEYGTRGITAQ